MTIEKKTLAIKRKIILKEKALAIKMLMTLIFMSLMIGCCFLLIKNLLLIILLLLIIILLAERYFMRIINSLTIRLRMALVREVLLEKENSRVAFLEAITNQLSNNWLIITSDGIIKNVSQGFLEISDYEESFLIGKEIFFIFERGPVNSIETFLIKKNRTRLEIVIQETEIKEVGILLLIKDLTEEKRMEQLEMAREIAEATAQAKSTFLSSMSHEIRTPLNSIIGFVNLMTQNPDKIQEYIPKIQFSSNTLLEIINNILDLSKIEANKMAMEKADFNLYNIIKDCVEIFSVSKTENVEISFHINEDVPINLIGDSLRIKQVFINLIGNAVKFTESGSIRVETKLVSRAKDYCEILFSVSDTGKGMTNGEIKNLFAPFFQTSSSIARKHGGTGLGLNISKELVELMGGKLTVTSKTEKGSTFSFSLRFGYGKEIIPPKLDLKTLSFSGEKVLLVEDDILSQQVAKEILENMGLSVDTANNGKIATEVISTTEYKLVLMDINMPIMDGFVATNIIRGGELKIPIIAMTASSDIKEKYVTARMDGYIMKPINPIGLFNAIVKFIKPKEIEQFKKENNDSLINFPEIAGVDVKEGLERINGNKSTYKNLLLDFANNYRDMIIIITKNKKDGDLQKIKDNLHKIKGSAGNLSLTNIYSNISELEKVLEKEEFFEQLTKLNESLQLMFEDIKLLRYIEFQEVINNPKML
ncbi:MAG: ATP-binding protein [Candidatus Gracilibacteria bacterium]|nr:ATP-binding protein [Candidatus Gracilibacteria bacterium]MDD3119960.1 ATP-binding protein [Candidatus Gracilibacteria bacterium]MDD4529932.1 ATP-binding protein [Candidatus Gracilibacteria bacterium]